ncbi:Peptidase S11 D-alanyl-D-alanine carboxypeptidase 1 [Streptomyces sp. KO7888]|uniref:D-alanyl-D-alanine carboxypeptidase family protein n=1 Tax=Streptomyces sp. KO7888 TaxID=2602737 RepID=UPI0013F603DE|nr:serine hydrolase [Streptomyces sp. KO7888]NHI11942.1 Peptidase S11 D-alanyl-D-alanine carboxypeptidase 1 [Streptomyces sp. KO7888]
MRPVPEPGEQDGSPAPPSASRLPHRLRRRPALLAAGATALVTLVTLGSVLSVRGSADDAPSAAGVDGGRPGASLTGSLPWPDEGQAAVLVEGFGPRGAPGVHGPGRPVPIASVTKVMTAYVILRDHPLRGDASGPLITVDDEAANESFSGAESTVEVRPGQRLSQRRLLELMLVPSGNNIARLLARWDAGSQEAFVARMNRAADDLGMDDTTYTGASGIESTTTSTAADQLRLARKVMRDDVFRSVAALPRTAAAVGSGTIPNSNELLNTPGVIGIKTGSSTPAGGALMWAVDVADRSGRRHLALGVVLHQRAGTSPQEGLRAVFDASRALVEAVRHRVAATGPATASATDAPSGTR